MNQPVKKTRTNKTNGNSAKVPYKSPKKSVEKEKKAEEKKVYQHYVKSKDFQKVREAVFERDGHRCMFCGATEDELKASGLFLSCHHIRYDNAGFSDEREIADCISVCNCCHFHLHQIKRNLRHFADKSKIAQNIKERDKNKSI